MMNNDENRLNELFNHAKKEPAKLSFKETKEQFTHTVNSSGAAGGKLAYFTNLKHLGMITILSALAVTAIIYSNSIEETKKKDATTETTLNLVKTDSVKAIEETEKVIQNYYTEITTDKVIEDSNKLVLVTLKEQIQELSIEKVMAIIEKQNEKVQRYFDEPYRFPKLTAAEIKANNKQKAKMLKSLNKLEGKKSSYVFIPSGKYDSIAIQGFFMQKTEVTNLEYRTFLFDLLIQGKNDEFLVAQPDQTLWTTEYPAGYNKPMEENYFSHPAYNEYPVVAISRKGAEMYSEWLTQEVFSKYGENGKWMLGKIRLPLAIEWTIAAKGGDNSNTKFGFTGKSIKNETGCYLANFNPEKDASDDGGMHTVKVTSYHPNSFGLFCMSGNAAEMVLYRNADGTTTYGTKGGSWNSNAEELEINGADKWRGRTKPSVNIGFRVVMSLRN